MQWPLACSRGSMLFLSDEINNGEHCRVGHVPVDVLVQLHHAKHQHHHIVDDRDHRHRAQQPQWDAAHPILDLHRHGRNVVKPAVRKVHDHRNPNIVRHEGL
jgi:hypothetical protein